MYTKTHPDNIHADLVMHSINGATVIYNDIVSNPFGNSVETTANNDVIVSGNLIVEKKTTLKSNAEIMGVLTISPISS
jgi:hypothetical protein